MAIARTPLLHAALLLAAAVLLSTAGNAQTTIWEFTSIAEAPAGLASFSVPSINDAGQIAVVVDDVVLGKAVYRYEPNGLPTTIADTSGSIASFNGDPAMNIDGLVTFTATMDDGSVSVLCGNGGALVTIANTVTNSLTAIDSKPFISDTGGVVVVRAVKTDGTRVILKGAGGAPVPLLDSTGSYDPQDVAGITADGMVAFVALNASGETGIYRTIDGVEVTLIAETGAGGFIELKALDINNNGTVVYFRETATGNGELVVDTAGTSTPFADTVDPSPFNSFGPASVAESGATAFRGIFDLGLNAIFAGGTGRYEKAIALGDSLGDAGVTALDTGSQAVTNSGYFVFRAGRGDGTTGIYTGAPRASGGGGGGGGGAIDGASLLLLLLASRVRRRPHRGSAQCARSAS